MISLFNKKEIESNKKALKRAFKFRQISKEEFKDTFFHTNENTKQVTLNTTRKDENSRNYKISTLLSENSEISKKKYQTIFAPKNSKNNNNNYHFFELFKNTVFSNKMVIRSKTASKPRKKKIIYRKLNLYNLFKYYDKTLPNNSREGVPLSFMESMRLNTQENLAKTEKFFDEEKKRLIKENPFLKYKLQSYNNQKKKKEEIDKVNRFKLWKKNLQSNKKTFNGNYLNNHHIKLLLQENNQYFKDLKPIIDKTKFNPKFRTLTEGNRKENQKKNEIKDIRKIFVKYFEIGNKPKQEKLKLKKNKNISKDIIYKRFKIIIKKCAIEFKNMNIPLNEYVKYFYSSKNVIKYLFNEDYCKLIQIIKREEGPDITRKEKEVINYLTNNKSLVHTKDFYGQNVLFLSIKYKLYKTISKLVQFGANINLQDFKGRTPLHFSAKYGDLISLSILLYYLADPSIKDNKGEIPLDYASSNKDDSYLIKELLKRSHIITKFNKYRSWKLHEVFIRRGIQYYLNHNLSKEKYNLIFSFIDNVNLYYS